MVLTTYQVFSMERSEFPELLPPTLDNYANIELPNHFLTPEIQALDNTPSSNPITDAGATLGRVLFYDKKLSSDGLVSCGSCHQQKHGFSNALPFGVGVNGQITFTKSLPLANLRYRSSFGTGFDFSVARKSTLEEQSLLAFTNTREMNNVSIFQVISIINQQPYYENLFFKAFGDKAVSETRIAQALSQFMRSMLSFNSKFDRGIQVGFTNFTPEENLGRALFNSNRTKCSECHSTVLQLVNRDTNGMHPGDILGLSTASLRNIGVRKHFGLTGGVSSLERFVEHYNRDLPKCNTASPVINFCDSITSDPTNPLNNNGSVLEMELSLVEEKALVSFLKTLSDPSSLVTFDEVGETVIYSHSLLAEKKYSDPFFKRRVLKENHIIGVLDLLLLSD